MILGLVVLGCLAGAAPVLAQPVLGPEVQVNSYTTGQQWLPDVALHGDGSFEVVWASGHFSAGRPEDEQSGIFLRRFDAAANPLGGEVHVNEFTADYQTNPRVSDLAGGEFVVVWDSGCFYPAPLCGPDGDESAVASRRFDATAAPLDAEQIVNTFINGTQFQSVVAGAPTGEFVVAWSSFSYDPPGLDPAGIVARRFAADGQPASGEFLANDDPEPYQYAPDVAVDEEGKFIVVWTENDYLGSGPIVRGQRFDAGSSPLGAFTVVDDYPHHPQQPAVAAAPTGDFVIVWTGQYFGFTSRQVRAQRFAADGSPQGGPFTVNTTTFGEQYAPAVATDTAGNFVVTWTTYDGTAPQDGESSGVFGQAFAHDGAALGWEFQVNETTAGRQFQSAIAGGAPGQFVATWTSNTYGGEGGDGDEAGVFARHISLPPCSVVTDCVDTNPCTVEACEDGVCLARRESGCCQGAADCLDDDPCTDDACEAGTCSHVPVAGCVPCDVFIDCVGIPQCSTATCKLETQRCEFTPIPGCCTQTADCDDGLACTTDSCNGNTCVHNRAADCVDCAADDDCATGCLIAPATCEAGRCGPMPRCPIVTIDTTEPTGADGKLLVRVELPPDLPGKGKVKVKVRGAIGALDAGDTPKRRCRTGKSIGRARATLELGAADNVLLSLTKAGGKCLLADPDGALPIEVTVQVRRKKLAISEVVEPRVWRR